jgi:diguanylate cyclase (GGDEF)-like protein
MGQNEEHRIEELEKLTEYEISYLKTFEERLETIYPHEKEILRLAKKLNEFIKSLEGKLEKDIIEIIGRIKKDILSKFKILEEETEEEALFRVERAKKKDLLDIENFILHLYEKIGRLEEFKGKKAQMKIKRALRVLKQIIEKEERGITLNEHVFFIIDSMHSLKEGLKNAIRYESNILDSVVKHVKDRDVEELENNIMRLKEISKQVKNILRTEKYEVYKPLMTIVLREIGGAEQFKKMRKKDKITLDDVKKDIFTMTDTNEISEYLKAIPMELVEEEALPHLLNYRLKAREIAEKQKRETVLDPLLRIFSRKIMDETLDNLIRNSQSFSFILLDIDHFKSVNDSFGHQEGDRVLKTIARLIKSQIRVSDFVCRYGGEEIAVILPRTLKKKAEDIAERIRKDIEKYDFDLPDKRHVTISGGVSVYPAPEIHTKEEVIKDADDKLYKAKKRGRNRIII